MSNIRPAEHAPEDDPFGHGEGAGKPTAAAVHSAAPAAVVLTAAATASTTYTAAAAKGAATALVRMFMEQGVFGLALDVPGVEVDESLPTGAPAQDVPKDAEPTDWDRMCAAVRQAESRREANISSPAVPGLRLMGEAVSRAATLRPALQAVPQPAPATSRPLTRPRNLSHALSFGPEQF